MFLREATFVAVPCASLVKMFVGNSSPFFKVVRICFTETTVIWE